MLYEQFMSHGMSEYVDYDYSIKYRRPFIKYKIIMDLIISWELNPKHKMIYIIYELRANVETLPNPNREDTLS